MTHPLQPCYGEWLASLHPGKAMAAEYSFLETEDENGNTAYERSVHSSDGRQTISICDDDSQIDGDPDNSIWTMVLVDDKDNVLERADQLTLEESVKAGLEILLRESK
jgi:hypothetical protein